MGNHFQHSSNPFLRAFAASKQAPQTEKFMTVSNLSRLLGLTRASRTGFIRRVDHLPDLVLRIFVFETERV